jgi:hypothetical protein
LQTLKKSQIISVCGSKLTLINASDLTKLFCYGDHLANLEAITSDESKNLKNLFPILTADHNTAVADFINKELVVHLLEEQVEERQ